MVGTHFPEDRDVLESALQRMREAFEALRDGQLGPARADEEFLAGYDTARDIVSSLFRADPPAGGGAATGLDPFDCAAITLTACRLVVRQLTDDELAAPTPCTEYTVAEVGLHVVRSMVLLASVAGEQLDAPVAGTLEDTVTATAEAALTAWRRRGLGGTVAVGRSVLPAGLAVEIIPLELLVHGWDIAWATGRDLDVSPAVAGHVLARARQLITADKRGRSFAAEVTAGPEATVLQRLIAFTGRTP